MGCAESVENSVENRKSRQIDEDIKKDRFTFIKTMNLLLLGTGESGKTTLVKQMKLIYAGGFSDDERNKYIEIARVNAIQSMSELVAASKSLNVKLAGEGAGIYAEIVETFFTNNYSDSNGAGLSEVSSDIIDSVVALWEDAGIQECLRRRNEFQLLDNAQYFLPKFAQICDPGYQVTDNDVINSRVLTVDSHETFFDIDRPGTRFNKNNINIARI